jgi:hypothetical protein
MCKLKLPGKKIHGVLNNTSGSELISIFIIIIIYLLQLGLHPVAVVLP